MAMAAAEALRMVAKLRSRSSRSLTGQWSAFLLVPLQVVITPTVGDFIDHKGHPCETLKVLAKGANKSAVLRMRMHMYARAFVARSLVVIMHACV